jgi:plastocyanin
VTSRLLGILAVVLLVGAAACGDTDDEPEATGADDAATDSSGDTGGTDYGGAGTGGSADAPAGTIIAEDYSLTSITVGPGDEIKLKNEGDFTHTATADDGEFDLGEVEGGATSAAGTAPEEPGTYEFHCEIHRSMTATLTVEG